MRFKDPQKVHGVVGGGVSIADEFVQIRLGGDMALFAGLGKLLLEAHDKTGTVLDRAFIDEHCAGFAEYEAQTRAVDLDTVTEATGVPARSSNASRRRSSPRSAPCSAGRWA